MVRASRRLQTQIRPLRADLVTLDAHQRVDHLRARKHTIATQRFIGAHSRDATVFPVPLQVVAARTNQNSFQGHFCLSSITRELTPPACPQNGVRVNRNY